MMYWMYFTLNQSMKNMANQMMSKGRGVRILEVLKKMRDLEIATNSATVSNDGHDSQQETAPVPRATKRQPISDVIKRDNVTVKLGRFLEGDKDRVIVNYLKVHLLRDPLIVFQYRVDFEPEIARRSLRCELIDKLLSNAIGVYDGRNVLYVIDFELKVLKLKEEDDHEKCSRKPSTVTLKLVKKMVNEMPCFVLNTLFRNIMSDLRYSLQKRKYFDMKSSVILRHARLEVWPGIVTSSAYFKHAGANGVDTDERYLLICLDVCHRVVRTISVYQMMQEFRDGFRSDRDWREEFKKTILGSIVITKYNNKTYRIDDVSFEESVDSTFELSSNGESITYSNYYKKHYNISIEYLHQPLILSRIRSRDLSTPHRIIRLIPELCYMTGLTDSLRSDFKAMKDLSTVVHLDPNNRMDKLKKFIENVLSCEKACERLRQWHLQILPDFLQITARIRPAEVITFARGSSNRVDDRAEWTRDLNRLKIAKPVQPSSKWLIVCPKGFQRELNSFVDTAVRECVSIGMNTILKPAFALIVNDRASYYVNAIDEHMERNGQSTNLIVCIVPDQRDDRYTAIKRACCITHPVASQVILTRTLTNANKLRTIVQRILMQIVCKLGGFLWTIRIPTSGIIIFGVDVYHHGGTGPLRPSGLAHEISGSKKSVVGCVACITSDCSKWYSKASTHSSNRQEISDGLRSCYIDCIRNFHLINNCLPKKLILYRDSVGDSQIDVLLDHEVQQLQNAIASFGRMEDTELVAIAVNKRINSRIIAQQRSSMSLTNPRPGTVVDTDICRFSGNEFLLISQNSRQGTVSPIRYVVIKNTSKNLNLDRIQTLTFKLTHMYFNWPGTIAVPAPCQYAHKLAYLVGQHIRGEFDSSLSDKLFYL